jgi:hypothetical protein
VASSDAHHWQATFIPAGDVTVGYEMTAAVLVSALSSDVKAGENAGRRLEHDFAAVSLMTVRLAKQTNHFGGHFVIDSKSKQNSGRLALAVWVTQVDHLEPVQATGGWLPDSK